MYEEPEGFNDIVNSYTDNSNYKLIARDVIDIYVFEQELMEMPVYSIPERYHADIEFEDDGFIREFKWMLKDEIS